MPRIGLHNMRGFTKHSEVPGRSALANGTITFLVVAVLSFGIATIGLGYFYVTGEPSTDGMPVAVGLLILMFFIWFSGWSTRAFGRASNIPDGAQFVITFLGLLLGGWVAISMFNSITPDVVERSVG